MHGGNPGARANAASWPEVRVACVWLPQLPLRVEVLRHPAWDGRPLVLAGGPGEGRVVKLCSPEAERAGIRPGLPLREVLALCREAIILQPDPVRIEALLRELLGKLQRVSPAVEPGEEHLFLDLRGLRGVYHSDLGLLERAARAVVPPLLQPRIGVAGGPFTALVAARLAPPSGMRVVPSPETPRLLAPLPIGFLPLPPDALRRLDLLGLRSIADLAALPFAAVQAQLGPPGACAWRLAHGQDDRPIVPQRLAPAVRTGLRCDDPLASADAILAALRHLLARAFDQPAIAGRAVRQARLRALLADGASWERLVTFKEALAGREAAYRALKSKLQLPGALPPAPVAELALELLGLDPQAAKQPGLLLDGPRPHSQLAEAARQLRARYGQVPLYHVVEVEPWSRMPERRWALMPFDL